MARLIKFLDGIGWRYKTKPSRRARLIARDPEHALACAAEYRAIADAEDVKYPAALFNKIFEGELGQRPPKARGDPVGDLRRIQAREAG